MNTQQRMLKRPSASPMHQTPAPATAGTSVDTLVCDLVNELMNATTSFHKLHLKMVGVGSYAAHKSLNELYDALPGHADDLVEQYQGACEMILSMPDCCPRTLNSKEEAIQYMRDLKVMTTNLQSKMPHSEISNELDNVKSTLNSIKYKLMFLS